MFLLYFKGQPHHMLLAVQDWKMAWLTARLLAYLICEDVGKGKLTRGQLRANHPM